MVLPRRLNILHVVDSLELGGLERVVTDLAITQAAAGDQVKVFSISNTAGHRLALEAAGIEVVQGGKRRTADPAVLRALWNTVRGHGTEVVHAHNFVPNYYAAAALLPMREPPALVATCHDMGFRLADRKLSVLFRLSLARTSRVAMVSRQVYGQFVASGMVKESIASVIMNGVAVERIGAGAAARQSARRALQLPEDAPVIGSVGRMVPLKNHRALIEAMPALLVACPDVRLVLAGDGPLGVALQEQAAALGVAQAVQFLGLRTDVSSILPAFDIFALPSMTEGLSIALMEACAAGLAIVASDVGGNPEIVQDGVRGVLFPTGNQTLLQDALLGLLQDSTLRKRLGENARSWVCANGSIAAASQAYHACYLAALQESRRAAPLDTIAT
jgi:glycosyltransferase involved in cell wall biosynthesis